MFATAISVSSVTPASAASSASRTGVRSTVRVSMWNFSATSMPSSLSMP